MRTEFYLSHRFVIVLNERSNGGIYRHCEGCSERKLPLLFGVLAVVMVEIHCGTISHTSRTSQEVKVAWGAQNRTKRWHCCCFRLDDSLMWGCPVHCQGFSCISGFYPQMPVAPPNCDNQRCLWMSPGRGQNHPTREALVWGTPAPRPRRSLWLSVACVIACTCTDSYLPSVFL